MSRGQQTFKQSDVTKALKATVKAGIAVGRVEIDKNGKIVIVTARLEDAANGATLGRNEWDGVLR
jgi:predicted aspartyl protease